jgi:hypothetical protein
VNGFFGFLKHKPFFFHPFARDKKPKKATSKKKPRKPREVAETQIKKQ